jgi:hypothetical protein
MNRKGFVYVTVFFGLIALFFFLYLLLNYTGLFTSSANEKLGCATAEKRCACQLTGGESCPSQASGSYRTKECPLKCEKGSDISSLVPVEDKKNYGLCCVAALGNPWPEPTTT